MNSLKFRTFDWKDGAMLGCGTFLFDPLISFIFIETRIHGVE
jgi:hypothetical protein